MKNKTMYLSCAAAMGAVALIFCTLWCINYNSIVPMQPLENPVSNNNNYSGKGVNEKYVAEDCSMAYCNGAFYYTLNGEDIYSLSEQTNKRQKCGNGSSDFRVYNDDIIFRQVTETDASQLLFLAQDGRTKSLVRNVLGFQYYGDECIYLSDEKTISIASKNDDELPKKLFEASHNILWFTVENDKLYVIYYSGSLYAVAIDLTGTDSKQIMDTGVSSLDFLATVCDKQIVLYSSQNFYNVNFDTRKVKNLGIYEYVTNLTSSADNNVYFTVEKITANGLSSIRDNGYKYNGLYRLTLNDSMFDKISSTIYDKIFVCDDKYVFGKQVPRYDMLFFTIFGKASIHQIDADTKTEICIAA